MSLWSSKPGFIIDDGSRHETIFKPWGDKRDETTRLQSAIQQAKGEDKLLRIVMGDLGGDYLLSEPIITEGVSIVTDHPRHITAYANPDMPHSNWKVGANANDVGLFVSLDEDDVFFEGLGIDGQDSYIAGIAFFSGENLRAEKNYVHDTSNCGIQFYGSNATKRNNGDLLRPVTNGVMRFNDVRRCRWTLVSDGENYGIDISHNYSEQASNRHISIDPIEAGAQTQRNIVVVGNTIQGKYDMPESWKDTPSSTTPIDYAIGTKSSTYATIVGNHVHNWTGKGIGIRGLSGSVTGNTFFNDEGVPKMEVGMDVFGSRSGMLAQGNSFTNAKIGLNIDRNSGNGMVSGNVFQNVDTGIVRHSESRDSLVSVNNFVNGSMV